MRDGLVIGNSYSGWSWLVSGPLRMSRKVSSGEFRKTLERDFPESHLKWHLLCFSWPSLAGPAGPSPEGPLASYHTEASWLTWASGGFVWTVVFSGEVDDVDLAPRCSCLASPFCVSATACSREVICARGPSWQPAYPSQMRHGW